VIRVPRNTVFRARVMTKLKINCTVTQYGGCHRSPQVSWCKIYGSNCKALNHSNYIETEWKNVTEHEGMAFLTFLKLSLEDEGLYRCKEGDNSISHAINVTVTGKFYWVLLGKCKYTDILLFVNLKLLCRYFFVFLKIIIC